MEIDRFNQIADLYIQLGEHERVKKAIESYPESNEYTNQLYLTSLACIDFRKRGLECLN